MRNLVLASAACLALGGCVTTGVVTGVDLGLAAANAAATLVAQYDPALIAKANATLAKLAGNNLPVACNIIQTAEGYYSAVAFLIPPQQAALVQTIESEIGIVCSSSPTNVPAAITTLGKLWAGLQAGTTVPKGN